MKRIGIAAIGTAVILAMVVTVGCIKQTTLASLVTVLGNATASVAALEGNTTLAAKLKADTATASADVLNWKAGTPATEAIEALNIVEDDLNLFPITGAYVALIDLGIGTVESIIELLPAPTTGFAQSSKLTRRVVTPVHIGKWHNPPEEFKARWNAICATDAALASVASMEESR
jgi:hypothetical protein